MKPVLPVLALAVVLSGPLKAQDILAGAPRLAESQLLPADQLTQATQNFDDLQREMHCRAYPRLTDGTEEDGQLFREPARPDELQPIRAVDYAVDECSLLVMADGRLMQPPEQGERGLLLPAQ